MRDSFTLYRSVFNALKAFPAEYMKEALVMIGDYAMDGVEPDVGDGVAYGLFLSVKPLLDKSARRAEAGRRGGESKPEANDKQTEATSKQTQANDKQTEAKEERRNKKVEKGKEDIHTVEYEYRQVVDYLNEKAGTSFRDKSRDTRIHIKARFDEGFQLSDFYKVIDNKVAEWKGTDMAKYLRPSTLFGTKFESYLNQQAGKKKVTNFDNFESRKYDFDELEKQLLKAQGAI